MDEVMAYSKGKVDRGHQVVTGILFYSVQSLSHVRLFAAP